MFNTEGAMVEWPQERRYRLSNPVHVPQQRLADIPANLLREVEATGAFTALIQALVDAFKEKVDPREKLAELSAAIDQQNTFGDYDETVRQVVLALAGIAALRKTPTREMWEYLWSLAWHSAPLETFLPQAVIAASTETTFRDQFFVIARNIVEVAAQNPGRRAIQREKKTGGNQREHWQRHPQLSALWRGGFEHSFHAVGSDDDHVLSIVAEIDVAEFVRLLALYDYPDPVAHALMWCGASWRFERWKAVASVAPAAFGEQAKWNGSLILPLLLGIARDQFQFGLGHEPTPNQVSEATNDIKSLAAEVAKTIAPRADAVGCMTRWGNWLVRTAIPAVSANPLPHPTDAASQGFIEDALLEALIVKMPADRWSPEPAPDAEPWEPWCQVAAGALIALGRKSSMPSPSEFFDEWHISPDEWPTQPGQSLKLHAIPFEGAGPRADGYGARLLAIPMVEAGRADDLWKQFWDSTDTLREIVEFGDPDETENDGWQGRNEAAKLLMLQFSVGLMMLDHLIEPQRPLEYDRSSAIENLLPCLHEAVREMAATDQLNREFWSEAVRHLAIRRAKWLSGPTGPNSVALSAEVKPILADFIRTLAGDTENLLSLAYVARRNGVDSAALAAAFKAAEVDIGTEIAIAEHLFAISPRAIGINAAQINAAREILHDASPDHTILHSL
ncbi:hypothetical protein HF290_00960 [Acidithiobacillus ferrooxidans]|uniref:hypothetical protein n=1 Tax=Acidithiobacillus ferrooxidans TaxID=920 RepID=UPI001C06BF95|nr:hypothetical protein [Acidithiobacillus ferrooxidans]MBU2859041.1 hypothetical protein [Acidithiobacillus ferrooxidans]